MRVNGRASLNRFRVSPRRSAEEGISPGAQHLNARHEGAGVIFEIALVDAQEEDAIVRRREFGRFPNENEIVIIVANDRDQGAGRSGGDQFTTIGEGQAFGAGALVVAEVNLSGGADYY